MIRSDIIPKYGKLDRITFVFHTVVWMVIFSDFDAIGMIIIKLRYIFIPGTCGTMIDHSWFYEVPISTFIKMYSSLSALRIWECSYCCGWTQGLQKIEEE